MQDEEMKDSYQKIQENDSADEYSEEELDDEDLQMEIDP